MITIKGEYYKDGGLVILSDSYKNYIVVSTINEFGEKQTIHKKTDDLRDALETYERVGNQ